MVAILQSHTLQHVSLINNVQSQLLLVLSQAPGQPIKLHNLSEDGGSGVFTKLFDAELEQLSVCFFRGGTSGDGHGPANDTGHVGAELDGLKLLNGRGHVSYNLL
jgi:hypothetical protein